MENADAHRIFVEIEDLLGVTNGAAGDTKERLDTLIAKADTVIGLLTDIRALLLYQNATPGRHFDDVMNEARDRASHVTDRT